MKSFEKCGFRHYVHFFIALLIMHVATYLLRTVLFTGFFAQAVYDAQYNGNQIARTVTILYSFITTAFFCVYLALTQARSSDKRRNFLVSTQNVTLKFSDMFSLCGKKHAIHTAIYAAFQIPFLIFYSMFGIVYVDSTAFEDFYCMEAGFYEITKIGILGFLISCALFFIFQILLETLVYKNWLRNRI